jgi:site-specific recombinase XerD
MRIILRMRALLAGFIAPCLPTKTDKLPSGDPLLHEITHDGFRIIARKDGARVRRHNRPGNDFTRRFPLIAEALARLRSGERQDFYNRHGHRDATMILMAFRHGLRASELCSLRWEQVNLVHGRLHVHRLMNGMPSVHPLTGIELRALRRLQREQRPGRFVFMSERGAPMSAVAFRRMLTRLGAPAKMPFGIHRHMLRHSTGFKLANQGVDTRSLQHYLGHKNIQHTVRYSELSPERFRDFWKD